MSTVGEDLVVPEKQVAVSEDASDFPLTNGGPRARVRIG